MIWYQFVLSQTLNCLDFPSSSHLRSEQQKISFQLVVFINENCSQYIGERMTVTLNFINIVLPQSMGQYLQQFDYIGYQFITFQLDEDNYNKVKQISLVDFTIQFESSDILRGAIQTFEHTSIEAKLNLGHHLP
ncbi:Hypothetical_protein [Hexamita inflata]|uniref:Hypothetical_protein n=1 Tax=Hexamita inflata TaxID=28002 RepID=A0AA86NWM1_9EUKA|nr:Hypothetical protein HINF_LOCUS14090 [Hexamita inflata]